MSETKKIALHFAHANGFPAASYQQLFDTLPNAFEVFALNQFGHDARFPVNKNLGNLVDELIDYLHQTVDQPVYAVGHSMGALVSYMAACEAPQLFKGVIMLDPPIVSGWASWMFKLAKFTPLVDKVSPAGKAAVRCQSWPLDTDLVQYFSAKGLFRDFNPVCIEDYVKAAIVIKDNHQVLAFDATVEAQIFRNVPDNIQQYYGRMTVPSCLITAENSQVCIPANLNHFVKNTQIEHLTVPMVGHMFPLEQPVKVAHLIQQKIHQWESIEA
ncbi:alpha/beta hydrolase [Paraglaciecola sp.]|uniref:alpha/beta fold hydrolase n=1 Tax=Paraglaciecola sp. TaxID=1920173 RepID=UPI0030F3919E